MDSIVAGNALLAPLDAACHDLLRMCRVWKECLFAPPVDLSIRTFRERLLNVAADDRPLVVLAVDAIPYRLAKALWRPDWLIPLASVFPSTSSVAWPCIVSGQGPETTGVPGVVYRDAADRLYHCFRHAAWGRGKPDQSTTIADVRFSFAPLLFDDFASTHDCKLIAADLANWPSPWSDAFLPPRYRVTAPAPPVEERLVASLLVESAIASVETQLGQASRPTRIFCYINFDDYVHDHGYDETLAEALLRLERGVRCWTERGVDVVAISDHGMVPCDVSPERVAAFERLGDEPLSRLGIGGAGRVRWLYPHPRKEDRLIAMCEDLIGQDGVVLTAEALQASGFFPGDAVASGIGEIVVLATGPGFPVPDARYAYEHGSMTADEILVPFAHWRALQ